MKKKLLVVGVGSLIGRNLSELDLSLYDVFYTTRDKQKCDEKSSYIHFDLDDPEPTLKPHHFEACVYMADLPKIFSLVNSGLTFDRLIAFSTSSVLTKKDSRHAADTKLVSDFESAQFRLKNWCMRHNVSCVILQPTMVFDIGRDRNLTVMKKFIERFRFFPLVGDYDGMRKPVSAADLSLLVLTILDRQSWSAQFMIFTVSGGETMSFRELVNRLFYLSGARPVFIPVNKRIFRLSLKFLNMFGLMRNIGIEMIDHAEMDFVFDNTLVYQEFGFVPRARILGPKR
jgi:hypothetical protein